MVQDPPRCVFCRVHPVDPAWRPFCSERCRLQDLARWADETYRIPSDAQAAPRDPGDAGPDDDDRSK